MSDNSGYSGSSDEEIIANEIEEWDTWYDNLEDEVYKDEEDEEEEDDSDMEDFENSWWTDFDEDEESHLGVFCPYRKMTKSKITYQYLFELSEMTCQLLSAWKKWQLASQDLNIQFRKDFNPFELNLYQLDVEDRDELRALSVENLLSLFGGQEPELTKFKSEVTLLGKFLKTCMLDILGSCLPSCLPYVVLRSIHSYLQHGKGLEKIGQVTREPHRLTEKKLMGQLFEIMADVYVHLKIVLFNVNETSESSFEKKRSILAAKFKSLSVIVAITDGVQTDQGMPVEIEHIPEEKKLKRDCT